MRVQPVPGVSQATTVNSSASASIWLPHVERASPTTVKTPTTVDPADPQAGRAGFGAHGWHQGVLPACRQRRRRPMSRTA
jgi:hypothetical protein